MGRYAKQEADEAVIATGWPQAKRGNTDPEVRRRVAEARDHHHRCRRRLYISKILEDVDIVGGPGLNPTVGAALLLAFALYDIELTVDG